MSGVLGKSVLLVQTMKPTEKQEEWSATELSREVNMPVQTVHRLLSSLEEHGFVCKNEQTKKFRLGLLFLQMGLALKNNLAVRNQALPLMWELTTALHKPVFLAVPENENGILIEWMSLAEEQKKFSVGLKLPLWKGAPNIVMTAFMEKDVRLAVIEASEEKLAQKDLTEIKKSGYALSDGDIQAGTACVSAPVFNWENEVVASLSTAVSSKDVQEEKINSIIHMTKRAAARASDEMGWIKSDF